MMLPAVCELSAGVHWSHWWDGYELRTQFCTNLYHRRSFWSTMAAGRFCATRTLFDDISSGKFPDQKLALVFVP